MVWPPLPVFWHQYDGVDYSPSRIFNLRDFYTDWRNDDLLFLEGPIGYPADRRSVRGPDFDTCRPNGFKRADFVGQDVVFHEQDALLYRFEDEPKDPDYVRLGLRRLYDRLPHDPVYKRSFDLARSRIGDDYVGLHVRRGDVAEMLTQDLPKLADDLLSQDRLMLLIGHYVARTAPDDCYYPEIENVIAAGKRIVYFSDTPETADHFMQMFGRRHFIDAELFKCRYPIQKAFLDFNLLIEASEIISTGTNYASFASTLGSGQHTNVNMHATLERLEDDLYRNYLREVSLPPESKRRVRDALEKQFVRHSAVRRKLGISADVMTESVD